MGAAAQGGCVVPRVTFTPEAVAEAKALLAAPSLDGLDPEKRVLRIGIGSCGLRRPVATVALPEPEDERFEVDGIPVAVAPSLKGELVVGVGRGRFGAWLTVEERTAVPAGSGSSAP
jgi:hypothetical protein